MPFTEMTQAFIAGTYYKYLTQIAGENRGQQIFLHGVRWYGEQRGRRMAQRVLRDGGDLNFANYSKYGEWASSQEMQQANMDNLVEPISLSPDYSYKVIRCPWHAQFSKMDVPGAGAWYCKDLDASICRGYNPTIRFEVPQTLHDSDYCIQTIYNAGLTKDSDTAKKMEYVKGFDYHCAHLYFTLKKVVCQVLPNGAQQVLQGVKEDFVAQWGQPMWEQLCAFEKTDFEEI